MAGQTKQELRSKALLARQAILQQQRLAGEQSVTDKLLKKITKYKVEKTVGFSRKAVRNELLEVPFIAIYRSMGSELSTVELAAALTNSGYQLACPLVLGDGLMEFVQYGVDAGGGDRNSDSDGANNISAHTPLSFPRLARSARVAVGHETLGIHTGTAKECEQKPNTSAHFIQPCQIAVMVVPLVAFDQHCNRLGMGGGYYDRYLVRLAKHIPTLGIAFDQQLQKNLPHQPHDIALSAIITPSKVYSRKAANDD